MKLFIPKDIFDNMHPPRLFLCNTGKKIIGELPAYDVRLDAKWNAYAELSFSIDRQYVDVLTGELVINPLFDQSEGLRMVYVENIGYFVIQDPDSSFSDKDSKTLSAFSSEYSCGAKYLENFYINTGEVDSKEVLYNESIYGTDYTMDQLYKKASGSFNAYEKYYIKDYTDNDSYVWQQVEIRDESVYATYDGSTVEKTLYVRGYPNIQFYNRTEPKRSLLHYIFEKIPEWKIGHVDVTLWRKERKFSEDRVAVYDFIMNTVCDTFKCVCEWDTITNTVNFYEEAEDGINEDNTIQERWDTDVFISRENLASEINISYSLDDIKTKLKVSGADELDIREINLGKNYIMNLDFFHNLEWMEQDVFEAYDDYLSAVELYTPKYIEASQGRVAAYNKWNDLMYAVPAEGNVVLVGDKFEKLYCIYSPIDTAYSTKTITDSDINQYLDVLYEDEECKNIIDTTFLSDGDTFVVQGYSFVYKTSEKKFKCIRHITTDTALSELNKKLGLYHVNEDIKANNKDNILLRLKNSESDIATIRVYNSSGNKDNPTYLIQKIVVRSNSGLTDQPLTYTLKQWINGDLTSNKMGLDGFTVQYIGMLGSYFVLAKDERVKVNLQDYGIKLLQEKHDIYTDVFQAQTESMFSQEKYQCTASDEAPTGTIAEGTRWLDTDSSPVKLYVYKNGKWNQFEGDLSNYENYQRYIDNYEKLKAVQEVLVEKEKKATYTLDGFVVNDRRIDISKYTEDIDGVLRYNGQSLEADMHRVALQHFDGYTVTRKDIDNSLPLYTFTTSKYPNEDFAVYLDGTLPYVSYVNAVGVYKSTMSKINNLTELKNFFTEDQWVRLSPLIREDEFSDSNVLLNGLESEEERLSIYKELMDLADKELKTLSQPSLEFSMDMANILALPEFEPLVSQFQLGNFVRVHIRDGYVKRARLLEIHLNFDDLSDFSCNFGNLVTTRSEIDKHAELLSQAVSAGKQVAKSVGEWQRAVDKSNRLEEEIENGLQNTALEIGKSSGQNITWNEQGIRCRKLIDGTTDQYEDNQIAIINNKIIMTNDNWKTSKAALGEFIINMNGVNQTMYGLLADAVVSGYIEGSEIRGGSLEIGGDGGIFRVNQDGSVEILASDGNSAYATKNEVDLINQARQYHIELEYSGSTVFSELDSSCTITCKVYDWEKDITEKIKNIGGTFSWIRSSNSNDSVWNSAHSNKSSNIITITNDDIIKNAQFSCEVQFDDSKLT